ncbi:MAG: hypothetical protein EA422_02335 [Gemmatimonadales bacterium]|nr:MAG: hypothetical protein EA422_02335 [Gemmatimonadales bacterium]
MRRFAFLVLLFFAPLQGLVLFCPFEVEAVEARAVEITPDEAAVDPDPDGHCEDRHGAEGDHPTPPSSSPDSHVGHHGSGTHVHDSPTSQHESGGAHHHTHDSGEECVAMAACSAPVAPARDAGPTWGHFLGASVDMVLAEAPLAVLSPADPPPPRRT